ncbi:multicomponent Na+:H+ antiporter subunit C [Nocardia amikacinitolerans]|uniref:Multicomponent Na+:H+ antiporter subunit C n=1 Tax=Nocardia amikacinitolerans TaxID=756689 RepID=A0A285L911_9NOCA|nr:Na(+)/H(+) antiporter subunit C [Nocardia amikacinitolerans]MCP2277430.1 multicomponent Na+:H+ antiporter subunit C [Nocardia amikacinitolerans]MCP2298817.1 multicomponent Na+:H+ antiporter subunit C [Nocardia amikacinitolerans]SNY81445.1 multicomponent Na+:H+ antiporter subunit C [Nocardia amikacinitolerans]
MTSNLTLLVLIGVLTACGVYLILERAVSKMMLGMILFGNAVNLLILTVGGPDGDPPIGATDDRAHEGMADPLAQAMVLTAIVITMGFAAFVLALAYRSYILTTTDDVQNEPSDAEVAARRDREDLED